MAASRLVVALLQCSYAFLLFTHPGKQKETGTRGLNVVSHELQCLLVHSLRCVGFHGGCYVGVSAELYVCLHTVVNDLARPHSYVLLSHGLHFNLLWPC